jgi:uncharacterized repeat protein (TIGR03833 family)
MCRSARSVQYWRHMARKPADGSSKESADFAHTPFARLANEPQLAPMAPSPAPTRTTTPPRRGQLAPPPRIRVHHESVGRSGKVITRIAGLPHDLIETVANRLSKALGCVAQVNDEHVILEGGLKERANEWLQKIGDVRKLTIEKAAPAKAASTVPSTPPLVATTASGTYRRNIRQGMKVAIVLKDDQPTGELTTGVVRDLLTSNDEHPRGIKVRLQSGQVGRVKIIYA